MGEEPLVSVIVPTRNNEATIWKCLASIQSQTYPHFEVIVVDNHSTDRTRDIAAEFGYRTFVKGPERNPQRNFGAREAAGRYLLFVDSDMELSPGVLADCVARARDERAQAVVIPEISFGQGFWTRCKALERSCYVGESTMELARFYDIDSFRGVGGFDERLVGFDDRDLHYRVAQSGGRLSRTEAVIWHNEGRVGPARAMRKKYLYGRSLNRYLNQHRGGGNARWLLFRLTFFRCWGRLLRHPLLAVGMLFMQCCELAAAGAGYIAGIIKPVEKV